MKRTTGVACFLILIGHQLMAQWNPAGESYTAGKVGIGTASLQISGTGVNNLVIGNGNGARGLVVNAGNSDDAILAFAAGSALKSRFMYNTASGTLVYQSVYPAVNINRIAFLSNGNVGIGTDSPQAKLAVEGNILAKEVKVKTDISVPDYVFEPDYELPALSEIEAYVKEHKHLPEIPPAKDIERDGLDLAEINLLLLKKVEELTLHIIKQEKQLDRQASLMERRQKEFDALRKEIESRIGSITNQ